ncbi:MAG: FeoB-associated Cys-rich membrane protein [Bacteroidetes bacterium]|nr:FeoB-associated Cys-rich membrane protein [Bacteroidota bacterium]MBI3481944.1 FeoB-associated Cys-rich membrane protein [Bacteroidota bacterium]
MIQNVLILLALGGAMVYIGRIIYKSFQSKNSCATGCGKCAESAENKAIGIPSKN